MPRNPLSTWSHRKTGSVIVAFAAVIAVSTTVAASVGEGGGGQSSGTPGTPENAGQHLPTELSGRVENIATDPGSYDPTVVTKFISGRGFIATQGSGLDADLVEYSGQTCVSPNSASTGIFVILWAPVEIPDGALIKQVAFYGIDSDATDIDIQLQRADIAVPVLPAVPTRTDQLVTEFTTGGVSGVVAVDSADNLNEVAGSFTPSGSAVTDHRFHVLRVQLTKAAAANHILCGIEVRYQVPVASADAVSVFHPITPVRAYDSRVAGYPVNGPIANFGSRVIDVSSGHDLATGAVTLANAVPAGATAITYNLTTDQSTVVGFVAITPGNADAFAASAINLNGTPLANGGTVQLAGDRTVKVWVGGGGTTQVIVDVTGYYTSPVLPNMAN
jgi:hypothetical protein